MAWATAWASCTAALVTCQASGTSNSPPLGRRVRAVRGLIPTLSALIVIFVLIVCYFAIPSPVPLKQAIFPYVAILGLLFLILGIALIVMTIKIKVKGALKWLLLTTGIFAICPFVFAILHNFFYALGIFFGHIMVLKYLFEFLHTASFIIALLVSPIGFLVGVVGSIVIFVRKRK